MSQNTVFIESAHASSVPAGRYKIKVTSVNNLLSTTSEVEFMVSGFMHQIPDNEILSVYPPKSGGGNYAGAFPNVQFKRSSLPWDFLNETAGGERSPYLFVALFEESEIDFDGNLNDDSQVSVQKADTRLLEQCYEKNKAFTYLEIPEKFAVNLPDNLEMKHLSHVRIQQGEERNPAFISDETAIVVSKRMVCPDKKYHAFICSYMVEESGKFNLSGTKKENAPNNLIVLYQWAFESFKHDSYQYNEDKFRGLSSLHAIKTHTSKHPVLEGEEKLINYLKRSRKQYAPILDILEKGDNGDEKNEILSLLKYEGKTLKGMLQELKFSEINYILPAASRNTAVNSLIGMGKIPLRHTLKSGGKMVSWYQGPFVRRQHIMTFKGLSIAPETGFDLGDFIPDHSERLIFYNEETKMLDMGYAAAWQLGRILVTTNAKVLQEIKKWKDQLKLSQLMSEQNEEYSPLNLALDFSVRKLPELIKAFIINLVKLIDFPYFYLFPHKNILPEESLRYFKLDNAWMISMLFGVFSVGNAFSLDEFKSYVLNDSSFAEFFDFKKEYSGLLLHSQIIVNWPQLNIEIDDHADYTYTTDLAPALRLFMTNKPFSKIALFMNNENGHFAIDFPSDSSHEKRNHADGLLSFTKEGGIINYTVSGYENDTCKKRMPFDLLFRQPKITFTITDYP